MEPPKLIRTPTIARKDGKETDAKEKEKKDAADTVKEHICVNCWQRFGCKGGTQYGCMCLTGMNKNPLDNAIAPIYVYYCSGICVDESLKEPENDLVDDE